MVNYVLCQLETVESHHGELSFQNGRDRQDQRVVEEKGLAVLYSLNISRGKFFTDFAEFLRPAKILSSKYLV